jgi:hypothetical protein
MTSRQVGLVGTEDYRDIYAQRAEVWQPEQSYPFIAVVVGIYEENHVAFPYLSREIVPLLGKGRGVDDGRGGDIFGGPEGRRDGDLGEDWLDFVRNKHTFDERGDETGLASALVAANANANWTNWPVRGVSGGHIDNIPDAIFASSESYIDHNPTMTLHSRSVWRWISSEVPKVDYG